MEKFTDAEQLALKQFKSQVSEILPDAFSRKDENLIRWLRARDLNLDKAEELIINSMKWRQENKIDRILDSGFDPEMKTQFPFWIDGMNRDGRFVLTIPFGEWDVRKSVEDDGPEAFTRFTNQMQEICMKRVRELNEGSNGPPLPISYDIITDFEGFTFRQMANMKSVNTILQIVGRYEAHYPETLGSAIVINAPTVFSVLFGMMKPLMTARTINKIQVFSSDRKQWEPAVLKIIPPEQIRERFGGTKL